MQAQLSSKLLFQSSDVPLLGQAAAGHMLTDHIGYHVFTNSLNGFRYRFTGKNGVALTVNDLTLLIGHIIVFQQLLTNIEIATFNLALRFFNGIGHHAMLDGLAFLHTQCLHEVLNPV